MKKTKSEDVEIIEEQDIKAVEELVEAAQEEIKVDKKIEAIIKANGITENMIWKTGYTATGVPYVINRLGNKFYGTD